jgi:hypothetical protein
MAPALAAADRAAAEAAAMGPSAETLRHLSALGPSAAIVSQVAHEHAALVRALEQVSPVWRTFPSCRRSG